MIKESDTSTVVATIDPVYASDEGEYLCYGFPIDRSVHTATAVKVIVNRHSGSQNYPSQTSQVEATLRSNVDFACILSPYEAKWRRVQGTMSDYTQQSGGKLYMYYVTLADSGDYECYTDSGKVGNRVRLIVRDPSATVRPSVAYQIRSYVEKSNIDFRTGESHSQTCEGRTNGNELEVKWYNPLGEEIESDREFSVESEVVSRSPLTRRSTLLMSGMRPEMAGRYECRVSVGGQVDSVSFDLVSMDRIEAGGRGQQTKTCDIVEATCRNGECVAKSVLCNGVADCSDGSDELNCGQGKSELGWFVVCLLVWWICF